MTNLDHLSTCPASQVPSGSTTSSLNTSSKNAPHGQAIAADACAQSGAGSVVEGPVSGADESERAGSFALHQMTDEKLSQLEIFSFDLNNDESSESAESSSENKPADQGPALISSTAQIVVHTPSDYCDTRTQKQQTLLKTVVLPQGAASTGCNRLAVPTQKPLSEVLENWDPTDFEGTAATSFQWTAAFTLAATLFAIWFGV